MPKHENLEIIETLQMLEVIEEKDTAQELKRFRLKKEKRDEKIKLLRRDLHDIHIITKVGPILGIVVALGFLCACTPVFVLKGIVCSPVITIRELANDPEV